MVTWFFPVKLLSDDHDDLEAPVEMNGMQKPVESPCSVMQHPFVQVERWRKGAQRLHNVEVVQDSKNGANEKTLALGCLGNKDGHT